MPCVIGGYMDLDFMREERGSTKRKWTNIHTDAVFYCNLVEVGKQF